MMNSQDNPLERPDNQELDVVDKASNHQESSNEELDDLWTDEKQSLSLENSENSLKPSANNDGDVETFDLELSELDFRNPPTQDMSDLDSLLDEDTSLELDIAVDLEATFIVGEESNELDEELESLGNSLNDSRKY